MCVCTYSSEELVRDTAAAGHSTMSGDTFAQSHCSQSQIFGLRVRPNTRSNPPFSQPGGRGEAQEAPYLLKVPLMSWREEREEEAQ